LRWQGLSKAGLHLTQEESLLGRESSNRIALSDLSVFAASLRHPVGRRERSAIRDLDSFNGTFVNGLPVKERSSDTATASLSAVRTFYFWSTTRSLRLTHAFRLGAVGGRHKLTQDTIRLSAQDASLFQPEKLPANARSVRDLNALAQNQPAIIRIAVWKSFSASCWN
jgi:pSer/pThr/pTyr-binding forkhead associated (FHA) protein